jgi:hypothetical protein
VYEAARLVDLVVGHGVVQRQAKSGRGKVLCYREPTGCIVELRECWLQMKGLWVAHDRVDAALLQEGQ